MDFLHRCIFSMGSILFQTVELISPGNIYNRSSLTVPFWKGSLMEVSIWSMMHPCRIHTYLYLESFKPSRKNFHLDSSEKIEFQALISPKSALRAAKGWYMHSDGTTNERRCRYNWTFVLTCMMNELLFSSAKNDKV